MNVNGANSTHDDNELNADPSYEAAVFERQHLVHLKSYRHIDHICIDVDGERGVLDILNEDPVDELVDTTDGTRAQSQHSLTKSSRDRHGRVEHLSLTAPDPSSLVVPPRGPPTFRAVEALQQQHWNFSAIADNATGLVIKSSNMENYSPRSCSSGYSTTQENDPEYIRKRLEAAAAAARSQPPPGSPIAIVALRSSIRGESSKTVDTGQSYDEGEMGHLTLNYEIPTNLVENHSEHEDNDERLDAESQGVDLGPRHTTFYPDPRTPAPKALFEHRGSVMGASQLFAATQPSSTNYRGLHGDDISSSRPSPDLFNNCYLTTDMASSPLLHRVGDHNPSISAAHNATSSPFHSPGDGNIDGGLAGIPNDKVFCSSPAKPTPTANPQEQSAFKATPLLRNVPEPHKRYISGKESQERRLRASSLSDDPVSTDDEWSDHELERCRLAKLRKDAAKRELAQIGSSKPLGTARSDVIEVPSTNNGRRRSIQEDYVAQCTGHDARDTQEDPLRETQPEVMIADSQHVRDEPETDRESSSQLALQDENDVMDTNLHSSSDLQEDTAPSSKRNDVELVNQLPGLDAATGSSSSCTDGDPPYSSPLKAQGTQALSEVSGNRNGLGTPVHKSLLLTKDDELVPETSPLEPHQRHYVGFENASQPVASGDGDEVFNPFSQDVEYETAMNAMGSPSPLQPTRRSVRRRDKAASQPNLVGKIESPPFHKMSESSAALSIPSRSEEKASGSAFPVIGEILSEYMTAPESFATNDLSVPEQPIHTVREKAEGYQMVHEAENGETMHRYGETGAVIVREAGGVEADQDGVDEVATADQPHKLRSEDMLKGPSRLLRRNTKGPRITNQDEKSGQIVPPSSATVISKAPLRMSRRSLGMAVAISKDHHTLIQTAPASTTEAGPSSIKRPSLDYNKPSSTLCPSKTRLSEDHDRPSPTFRSSTRKESLHSRPSLLYGPLINTNFSAALELNPGLLQQFSTPILSKRRKTGSAFAKDAGLFHRMAFSVSYLAQSDEKQRVVRHIEENGGRVLENGFDELFNVVASTVTTPVKDAEADPILKNNLTITAEAREIGFTCVIADKHSRRAKYMQALALGLPCIAGKWIEHCVTQNKVLDWSPYMLAAGESSFLGGAIRSRSLASYPAATASFENSFCSRLLLLDGKSILLVMGKKKQEEERKRAYLFLTHVLGAKKVKRVISNQEARKVLLEAESKGETWDWVYVDSKEEDAEKAIFAAGPSRKRKRFSIANNIEDQPPKRVRLISDEFVVQSLILGKLLEEE